MTDHLGGRGFIPIPQEYQIYNSYEIDPKWQTRFTIVWTSVLAFTTLASIPFLLGRYRSGHLFSGLLISEARSQSTARAGPSKTENQWSQRRSSFEKLRALYQSVALWSVPVLAVRWQRKSGRPSLHLTQLSLTVSQVVMILVYAVVVVVCFTIGAELTQNANRPGFIALSQLPVIILLTMKSPLPLPLFLPRLSYEHYNYLHRWAGRILFLTATVHGGMWLKYYISHGEWDQVWATKTKLGMTTYGLMGGVVLTSLKIVRRRFYQLFWIAHVCLFTAFFAALAYHTPYSHKWIYPCAGLYAYDLLVRMLRFRLYTAKLTPLSSDLVSIHIPSPSSGWNATQHVFVRIMRGPGIFESHPFTITTAPSSKSRGITLYAKVAGDWTKRLHDVASNRIWEEGDENEEEKGLVSEAEGMRKDYPFGVDHPGRKVVVMLDGPYGGLKLDVSKYGRVLLVAGGSGITFSLGAVEEILRVKRETGNGPKTIDLAWTCRDSDIVCALSSVLEKLRAACNQADIELLINVYLTSSEAIRLEIDLDHSLVCSRMDIRDLLHRTISAAQTDRRGMLVIAAGPPGLVTDTRQAISLLSVAERARAGGVEFLGECYAL